MTPISRLQRMSIIELETLRLLCIQQRLCKTGELNSFFLTLQNEVEKVLALHKKLKEVQ